ncbi:unnamed protein product [Sphagnum tenellum]
MDGQGSNDEDSTSNVEAPQDNVPAQAAGDANPEADPERVDPGTAGVVNMEDPRDLNTNADGQSTDAANDPHVDADRQAQALSEGDDEGSDASYEHEDDVWVTPVTTGFNVSKGFNITRSQRKKLTRGRREPKKVKSPSRGLYEKRFATGPQATAARLAARQARAAALPMDQTLPTRPTGARPKVPQPAQAAALPPQAQAAATQEEQQPQPATGGLAPTEEEPAPVIGAREQAQGRPPPTQAVIDAEKRRLEAIRKDKAEMEAERRRLDEISRKDRVEARQIHFDQMLEALKFIRKMHELVSDPSKREQIIAAGKIRWAKQRLTEELENFHDNCRAFLLSADTQERKHRAQKLKGDALLHANEILKKLNEIQAQVDTDVDASFSEQDESRVSDTTEHRGFRTSSPNQRSDQPTSFGAEDEQQGRSKGPVTFEPPVSIMRHSRGDDLSASAREQQYLAGLYKCAGEIQQALYQAEALREHIGVGGLLDNHTLQLRQQLIALLRADLEKAYTSFMKIPHSEVTEEVAGDCRVNAVSMLQMADKLYEQARTATRDVRNRIREARLPENENGPARETNREEPRPAKDSGTQNAEDPMREVRQLMMGLSERMNNIAKETQELRKHAQGTKARQTPPDELELGLFSRARDSAQPPRMDKVDTTKPPEPALECARSRGSNRTS